MPARRRTWVHRPVALAGQSLRCLLTQWHDASSCAAQGSWYGRPQPGPGVCAMWATSLCTWRVCTWAASRGQSCPARPGQGCHREGPATHRKALSREAELCGGGRPPAQAAWGAVDPASQDDHSRPGPPGQLPDLPPELVGVEPGRRVLCRALAARKRRRRGSWVTVAVSGPGLGLEPGRGTLTGLWPLGWVSCLSGSDAHPAGLPHPSCAVSSMSPLPGLPALGPSRLQTQVWSLCSLIHARTAALGPGTRRSRGPQGTLPVPAPALHAGLGFASATPGISRQVPCLER